MTMHKGRCHCGKVTYEVDGEIDGGLACNCSICQRKGALLWFVPREALRITAGEDALTTYTFNRHVIRHQFCATCGMHPFGQGTGPDGRAMAAINLRCIEGIDLAAVPVQTFDGRAL